MHCLQTGGRRYRKLDLNGKVYLKILTNQLIIATYNLISRI